MILHEQDWLKYPKAIPNYDTKNKSFLHMAEKLYKFGIKNCLWPIALIQPELKDVDPFREDLSLDLMVKIREEIRMNPWYYYREILTIPEAGGGRGQYLANRGNLSLFWSFYNHIDYGLIQIRQTGKSFGTDALNSKITYISGYKSKISLFTKDDGLRKENLERIRGIRNTWPQYLVPKHPLDKDNQSELLCKTTGCHYRTAVAQANEFNARNQGRGFSTEINQFDEGPFSKFFHIVVPAALPAQTQVRKQAIANGSFAGNIFTTTAGDLGDEEAQYMYNLLYEGFGWTDTLYDIGSREKLEQFISDNSIGDKIIIRGIFNHKQLGYDDQWLYEQLAASTSRGDAANRDFFNIWSMGSSTSPIPPVLAAKIKTSEKDPVYDEILDGFLIRWYKPKHEIEQYLNNGGFAIAGLDTSDAIGKDACTLKISDIKTFELLGSAIHNETNTIRYSDFIAKVLIKYKGIILNPEKNRGQNLIDSLLLTLPKYGIDPLKRIFNRIVDDAHQNPKFQQIIDTRPKDRGVYFYEPYRAFFGFNTTSASREVLYGSDVFMEAIKIRASGIYCKTLIDELLSLKTKDGRIDHGNGKHDDTVIAWLLSFWFLKHAKNIDNYGINPTDVLSSVVRHSDKHEKPRTITDDLMDEEQELLKEKIKLLAEKMDSVRDPVMLTFMEKQMNNYLKEVTEDEVFAKSMSELMLSMRTAIESEANKKKRMMKMYG